MGGRGYNGKRQSQKTSGRGRGKLSTTKTTTTPEKNTATMEFTPHTIGRHQPVTFDAVKEHILQELQIDLKHGRDIVDNLRSGVDEGIPLLKPIRKLEPKMKKKQTKESEDLVEVETAPEERKILQQGHDMEWSMAMKEYNTRKGEYEENINTAYGITLDAGVSFNGGNTELFFGSDRRWSLKTGGTSNSDDGTLIDDTLTGVGSSKDYRNIFTNTLEKEQIKPQYNLLLQMMMTMKQLRF